MARVIPEQLPSHATAGERRVFGALRGLRDDVVVYYEPIIRRRYPDFVVICPSTGLLVIEVKGWRLDWIESTNPHSVRIRQAGRVREVDHPARQARKYQDRLMSECENYPHPNCLMHNGRLAVAFAHLVILTEITRKQLQAAGLERLFPAGSTICKDELRAIWSNGAAAICRALRAAFIDQSIPPRPLSPEQIAALRWVIHPEVRLGDVRMLDYVQERNARNLPGGHRVIYGVAGSGKTVIIRARAKLLSEDPERLTLLLCYNHSLARWFKEQLGRRSNLRVTTFGMWAKSQGAPTNYQDAECFGLGLLELMQSGQRGARRYDAILIDEAQDFEPSWFKCAVAALKDSKTGELLIAYDLSQNIFSRPPIRWSPLGVQIRGGVGGSRTERLAINYRNTFEIISAAHSFAKRPQARDDDVADAVAVDPTACVRGGPAPLLVGCRNRRDQIARCGEVIKHLISGSLKLDGRLYAAKPEEVCVLYARNEMGLIQDVETQFSRMGISRVEVSSIHQYKGLQSKAVFVLCAEQLPANFKDSSLEGDRALFYVALTRAEDLLVVLHERQSPFLKELAQNINKIGRASVAGLAFPNQ